MAQPDNADTRKIVIEGPTTQWVEGLPIGNGDLGMMIHGSADHLTLSLSKADVWDYRVAPGQGLPEDKTTFDEMIARSKAGDFAWYEKLFPDWLEYENCSQPSMVPCGQIDLALLPGERVLGFRQELDFDTATARIRAPFAEYREHHQQLDIEAFAPARDDVIPVTLTQLPGKDLFGKITLWRQQSLDYDPPTAWREGDIAGLDMHIPESVDYTLAARVIGAKGRWQTTDSEAVFEIRPSAGPVVLLVTIVSSLEHADPRATALQRLAAHGADAPATLAGPHRAWWADYGSRSSVSLPDAELEKHWRLGMYLFGSISRPGKQCPGLQGVWNHWNRPPWHTDYHADGNVEIMHWPAFSGNHTDLTEPFYRLFMEGMRDEARRAARDFFKRRGLYIPIAGGPHGHELAAPWAWPGAGAWIALHFYWQWLYTRDEAFVRRAYPFLKELSEFQEDFLVRDDEGRYDITPTFSPEMIDPRAWLMMVWGRNATVDLAFVRLQLTALVEMSELLDVDAEDRQRWRDTLENLAPYPCRMETLLDVEDEDVMALEVSIPRIAPIYPAGLIGLGSSPRWRKIAKRTYDRVKPIFSGGGHCGIWCASAAAHLGDAAEALRILRLCISHRYANGHGAYFQIDSTVALPSAVNEMLMQSLDGVIRVFPAVPADWTVSFETLRAVGAFLVSARREAGRTLRVRIRGEAGCPCAVSDPFGAGKALLRTGDGREREILVDEDGCFRFDTQPGASYDLTPVE